MSNEILEKIITDVLRTFLSYDDDFTDYLLDNPNVFDKQRIGTIENLEMIIFLHIFT